MHQIHYIELTGNHLYSDANRQMNVKSINIILHINGHNGVMK